MATDILVWRAAASVPVSTRARRAQAQAQIVAVPAVARKCGAFAHTNVKQWHRVTAAQLPQPDRESKLIWG